LALKTVRQGDKWVTRPLLPSDIVKELNELDVLGAMTKERVRKDIRELERRGLVRQVGNKRKNVNLFVYARPLRARSLPSLGVESDPQIPRSGSCGDNLVGKVILQFRRTILRTFRDGIRKELAVLPNLCVPEDFEKIVDHAMDHLVSSVTPAIEATRQELLDAAGATPGAKDLGAQADHQKQNEGGRSSPVSSGMGVRSAVPYKEVSNYSIGAPPASAPLSAVHGTAASPAIPGPLPAHPSVSIHVPEHTLSQIPTHPTSLSKMGADDITLVLHALKNHGISPDSRALHLLIARCRELASDCTAQEIAYFIEQKANQLGPQGNAIRNRMGLILRSVPSYFVGEVLQDHRAECRAAAEAEQRMRERERERDIEIARRVLEDPEADGELVRWAHSTLDQKGASV
jgi:hypothetical protein